MRALPQVLATAAALCLTLTACSSGGASGGPATATPSGGVTAAAGPSFHAPLNKPADLKVLDQVKVAETDPAKGPTLTFAAPISVTATAVKVLTPGTGATSTTDSLVTVKQALYVGGTGKLVDSAYTAKSPPSVFYTSDAQTIPGLLTALTGVQKGSRVLFAIPPAEAFGDQGQTAASIGPKDDLVVVADVINVTLPQPEAKGTAVAPVAGQPAVTFAGGVPSIAIPAAPAPTSLVSQLLIDGTGPAVSAGQSVIVNYTGVVYATKTKFDSSWDRKTHFGFPTNAGAVIPGWDKGLVGKKVGSRVLLVIPPADGYAATEKQGIPANSTLVFVVDILAAA
ncbi:MAG: FKBP-type peptidyl-prolyl cis-trans isomerase [Lapillicoccus sp.]